MSGFMSPEAAGAFAAAHSPEIAEARRQSAEYDRGRRAEDERRERAADRPPPLRCIAHGEIKVRGTWHHNGTHWLPNDPALHYAIGGDALAERVPHIRELRDSGAFGEVPALRICYSVRGCGWVPTVPTMVHASQFPRQPTARMLAGRPWRRAAQAEGLGSHLPWRDHRRRVGRSGRAGAGADRGCARLLLLYRLTY